MDRNLLQLIASTSALKQYRQQSGRARDGWSRGDEKVAARARICSKPFYET